MNKQRDNYFNAVKLSDTDMMLAIAGFVSRNPEQSVTREEIDSFLEKFNQEYLIAKMTIDFIGLMRAGELIVCEMDGKIAWSLPKEGDREVYRRICSGVLSEL